MNSKCDTPGKSDSGRFIGFDVARAVAIYGMVTVHFVLVMADGAPQAKWSEILLSVLDGRPAATFMILAGIGVGLMARKAYVSECTEDRESIAKRFRRRALLLLVCGFFNLMIWQGDILRVYGVCLLLVPFLVWRSGRCLLLTAAGFVLAFGTLFLTVDYDRNWDWSTMTYHGLWTGQGFLRSLFYDGFRAVFPWTGLLVFGIWLGRLDWSTDVMPRKVLLWGAGLLVSSVAVSQALLGWLRLYPHPSFGPEAAKTCFGLASMPPLPLFLINAAGCALLVIGSCTILARRWKGMWLIAALAATGRMAFTWYVLHIVVGLGGIIAFGWTGTSHARALATASVFFAGCMCISWALNRRFAHGPMEFLLRKVSGR